MAGEGRPPRVDAMKCYMMNPHRVGLARPVYWQAGPSLRGVRVLQLATGRNHMAAIGVPMALSEDQDQDDSAQGRRSSAGTTAAASAAAAGTAERKVGGTKRSGGASGGV